MTKSQWFPFTPFRRFVAALTALLLLATTSCTGWRVEPLSSLDKNQVYALQGKKVRMNIDGQWIEMQIVRIEHPFVEGIVTKRTPSKGDAYPSGGTEAESGYARIDLRQVDHLQVEGISVAKSVFGTIGIAVAAVLIIGLIALATKESCPIVYIDTPDGWLMAGEAYAGSAFRSLQRDDLLPLPAQRDTPVRVLVNNEARETQYTDLAQLVVADHPEGTRVMATHEQHPVLVSGSSAVGETRTLAGDYVGELADASDGRAWESDMEATVGVATPPLRDGLVATFPAPAAGGAPVLELRAANTYLLDATFGRFFAMMGGNLEKYIREGNDPDNRERIKAWREREGVDLDVEVMTAVGWEPVAVVWTVGPMALRDIAVPLPAAALHGGEVKVRVSGGTGFWRIDRMALTTRVDRPFAVHYLPPSSATSHLGTDERAALATVDGTYNALEQIGENVELVFDAPDPVDGMTRSAFLYTSGYYNVHPPFQSTRSLRTLKTLRDEEGSLARFAIDLYGEYYRRAVEAPYEQAGGVR